MQIKRIVISKNTGNQKKMGNKLTCCGNKNLSTDHKDELIIEESQVLKIYKVSNADGASPEGKINAKSAVK